MGIPAFFRQIVEKYPKTHSPSIGKNPEHLFIDFNSIIYDTYYKLTKDTIKTKTTTQFEALLIKNVISETSDLILTAVNPTKTLYIALDGCAPRAKMIQQRWRRFKRIKDKNFIDEIKKKYNIEESKIDWDTSSNISPATKFMSKLSNAIKKLLNTQKFRHLDIIFSDSNVAGEGEHKFMNTIREMQKTAPNDTLCIYSPDADVIVLSMATAKKNIYIVRKIKTTSDATDIEKSYSKNNSTHLFLNIDQYTKSFIENLELNGFKNDPKRIIDDYIFLTFLGGNDFVMAVPYLKIKEQKDRDILIVAYKQLLNTEKDYLISVSPQNKYTVNNNFFTNIIGAISRSEDYYMRGWQIEINKVRQGPPNKKIFAREADKTPYEIEVSRYDHMEFYNKLHPEYEKYKPIYDKIDFSSNKNIWKPQYYEHFTGVKQSSPDYNKIRTAMCQNYLESLIFTLKYYFEGIPSWTWYYRFRAPPIMSDLYTNLTKFNLNINNVVFSMGEPYKPFDQLMMILPPQMDKILPKAYGKLMKTDLAEYYPTNFEIDILLGGKNIYSEPILPQINETKLISLTSALEKTLTIGERERNTVVAEPYILLHQTIPPKKTNNTKKQKTQK